MKRVKQYIILFWSIPTIASIKENGAKSNKLNQAIKTAKSVKVITMKDEVLNLKNVGVERGWFFGFIKVKGEIKKVLLDINRIKSITLI